MGKLSRKVLKEMHKSLDALSSANADMIDALEMAVDKSETNELKFNYFSFTRNENVVHSIKKDGEDYVVYDASGEAITTLEDATADDLYGMIIGAQLYDEEHNNEG